MDNLAEGARDKVMRRLQEHAGLSTPALQRVKGLIVASHYFSLPDHRGGLLSATARYYRLDGREVTFQDVPLSKIVKAVEAHIKLYVSEGTRTKVYHEVLAGVPGHKETPEWDKAPANPNEKPSTPFSKPDFAKSNQALLEDLASVAELSANTVASIGCQITWWDGSGDGTGSCMMTPAGWKVEGGRLGRDHKLEDVPVHYVRDCLMDYIDTQVQEDKQQAARRAICSDLTDAQIEEYSALLARAKEEREKPVPLAERKRAIAEQRFETARQTARQQLLSEHKPVRNIDEEARKIVLMEEALDSVDSDVNLSRWVIALATRDPERPKMAIRSVVKPGPLPMNGEIQIVTHPAIQHDCDQVRAMIKRFVTQGEWTLEEFRRALGGVTREQLTTFLNRRGNQYQLYSAAYQLSWEFFHRRERLGLPLTGVVVSDDVAMVNTRYREQCRELCRKRMRAGTSVQEEKVKRPRKDRQRRSLQEVVNQAD